MPTPRRLLVDLQATRYYHCISRCVRRAFLCGADPWSTRNFDHRKPWLVARMKMLAGVFAVDICAYAVLSNHFHVVLRVDRDRARRLSDEQVVESYRRVFPHSVEQLDGLSEAERGRRIAVWRERLWSLSWYMRCLNEWIARRANREDGCTGRFWEGRFRSQALLDQGAVLTCMSYVDLNPIRARLADTLETSEFTSIRERLLEAAREHTAPSRRGEQAPAAGLVPFAGEKTALAGSENGLREPLPMRFDDYVGLLEETRGAIRDEKEAALTPSTAEFLAAVGVNAAGFVQTVREFGRGFFTMVGEVHRIDAESRRRGHRRRPGVAAARRLYRGAA